MLNKEKLPYDGRKISKIPFKVLDAPSLKDDFYLNLLDWGSNNMLGVGLGSCIYLWDANSMKVTKLYDLGSTDSVTSICWSPHGNQVAVGTDLGGIQIWDTVKMELVRSMDGHLGRVGVLTWNTSLLSSGS